MSPHRTLRLPISTRHAYALAFDLAVRRDAVHSLIVPLLLRSPWILALAILPPLNQTDRPVQVMMLTLASLLGDFIMLLTVSAMLRFRAQSVFNTPVDVHPAPVTECYARAVRRVPWLFVTEVIRNLAIVVATFFLFLPALLLGYRLAFATETVVLHEPNTSRAFQRSFRLTEGRFERWLEMIVVSVVLVFTIVFVMAVFSVIFRGPNSNAWVSATLLLITAITPIIQYAWTFFYLRLVEVESPAPGVEVGPAYASAPHEASVSSEATEGTGVSGLADARDANAIAVDAPTPESTEHALRSEAPEESPAGVQEEPGTQQLADHGGSNPLDPDPENAPAAHRG